MIEIAILWCYGHPWVVSAACDLVTLSACMGTVMLMLRRRIQPAAAPIMTAQISAPVVQPHPVPAAQVELAATSPAPNRVGKLVKESADKLPIGKRRAVNRALDAMTRWEATYRPSGRGLADLARLAKKSADRVKSTEAWEE